MEARIVIKRECLTYFGSGVCREILRQAAPKHRIKAQIAMLHAAQELLLATYWKGVPPPAFTCTHAYVEWRFETSSYIFIPKVDDRMFEIYGKARKRATEIVLLVPSDYELLVRKVLARQRKRHPSGLFAVDDYLAWRTMWAGLDAGWSKKKVMLWWLSRYNRFVRRRKFPASLLIRLAPVNADQRR
jgi:hypothetical protein